jgi:hypothetical protein
MCRKEFSKALYDQYNEKGIRTGIEFLTQHGYTIKNTEEKYTHDFIVEKDGKEYKIETEITAKWVHHKHFPYRFMSVPFRKHTNQSHFYIRTNPQGTALFFAPMKDILSAPIIHKDTSLTKNEAFFNVDTATLTLYYKEDDGVWKTDDASA